MESSGEKPRVVVPDKADDVKVVERIAGGDADALGELYDRYGRVAFGVLYRMLPGPEAAEEVAQDAFHSVWRQARARFMNICPNAMSGLCRARSWPRPSCYWPFSRSVLA